MIHAPTISELIAEGHLVQPKYYAPTVPDMAGVRVRMGDYVESDLAERMDKPKLIGDVVENWGRLCSDRKTVVFATNVKHSIHLAEAFAAAGVTSAHLAGNTLKDDREQMLREFRKGDIQVLCNCQVLTEGWDQPDVSACVLARPTKSISMYLQMVGRVLRPAEGKADSRILDHAGAVHEHGFVEEFDDWCLEGDATVNKAKAEREKKDAKVIVCKSCFASFTGTRICPSCGTAVETYGKAVAFLPGDLGIVEIDKSVQKKNYTKEEKQSWFSALQEIRWRRGYAAGWVAHTYRAKFDVWPKGLSEVRREPTPQVLAFVKSLQIRHAKRKAA